MIPGSSCLLPTSPYHWSYLTNQTYRENAWPWFEYSHRALAAWAAFALWQLRLTGRASSPSVQKLVATLPPAISLAGCRAAGLG